MVFSKQRDCERERYRWWSAFQVDANSVGAGSGHSIGQTHPSHCGHCEEGSPGKGVYVNIEQAAIATLYRRCGGHCAALNAHSAYRQIRELS